ncbi:hypothetical protein DID78_04425 [Candidatus Marinamargulisbacteria bacterium SCGC AG-343-D04]|nr:hypothetical protein DID78_04425 [Candidatus Marinamargulisbacteria bacterium SCGC AG-343-D04]
MNGLPFRILPKTVVPPEVAVRIRVEARAKVVDTTEKDCLSDISEGGGSLTLNRFPEDIICQISLKLTHKEIGLLRQTCRYLSFITPKVYPESIQRLLFSPKIVLAKKLFQYMGRIEGVVGFLPTVPVGILHFTRAQKEIIERLLGSGSGDDGLLPPSIPEQMFTRVRPKDEGPWGLSAFRGYRLNEEVYFGCLQYEGGGHKPQYLNRVFYKMLEHGGVEKPELVSTIAQVECQGKIFEGVTVHSSGNIDFTKKMDKYEESKDYGELWTYMGDVTFDENNNVVGCKAIEIKSCSTFIFNAARLNGFFDSLMRSGLEDKVASLSLRSNHIHILPEAIGRLRGLIRLDISENRIAAFPDSFECLGSLRSLYMRNNVITALPRSLHAKLPKLTDVF